jgi:hypothetical protein
MTHKPIQDEYTDRFSNRQKRYYLRHRDEILEKVKQYDQSEVGKASKRERNARYRAKQKKFSIGNAIKDY